MNAQQKLLLVFMSSGFIAVGACTHQVFDVDCLIKENAGGFWNTSDCKAWRKEYCESSIDAGADAEPDADACRKAGFPMTAGHRVGRCGPAAPNNFLDPQAVWIGPVDDVPDACPSGAGSGSTPEYWDLQKPSGNECDTCSCQGPEGTCAVALDHLAFRNAPCGTSASVTTDVTPAANWNGSCSADGAINKGTECPAGSGTLCAQSLEMAALPKPAQSCTPTATPVLKLIPDMPRWKQAVLACRSDHKAPSWELLSELHSRENPDRDHNTCISHERGWRTCVRSWAPGIVECDSYSEFKEQVVVYEKDAILDKRSCSPCTCTPMGGSCVATLNLYEDNACTQVLAVASMDSDSAYCTNLPSATAGVGSKEVTSLEYVPGTCMASGGELSGDVELDDTRAYTYCCLVDEDTTVVYDIDR